MRNIDTKVNQSVRRVLKMFQSMEADSLDLHALFEAGGNDPAERRTVLDAVADIVEIGSLEPCDRGPDKIQEAFPREPGTGNSGQPQGH